MKKYVIGRGDVVAGAVILAGAVWGLLGIRGLPIQHKGTGFGSGAFPLLIASVLVLLAVLLIFRSFYASGDVGTAKQSINWNRAVAVLLATVGYITLVSLFGFLVSTVIFLFAAARIFGVRNRGVATIYAVVFTLLTHLLFTIWMKFQFPVGVFWEYLGVW